MGLKAAGAALAMKGGLLNRTAYVTVYTADPGANGANEFPASNGYARASIALAGWTIGTDGIAKNTAALNFPTPTAALSDPTWAALVATATDGASGDAIWWSGQLGTNVDAPQTGATFGWPAEDFTIQFTGVSGEGSRRALRSGLVSGTTYLSLHTGDPGTTGASEVSSAGSSTYERESVTAGQWDIISSTGQARLNASKSFGAQQTDLPNITHVGLWDAATSGNFLWGNALTTARNPAAGDTLTFASQSILITPTIDA